MFCEIYPQSVAHITTINECSTILQFTDPRSLRLDPQSRFPIFDSRSCLSSIKPKRKGNDAHDHAPSSPTHQVLAEVVCHFVEKQTSSPVSFCFPENEKTLGTMLDISWIQTGLIGCKPFWKRTEAWLQFLDLECKRQWLGDVCSSEALGRSRN